MSIWDLKTNEAKEAAGVEVKFEAYANDDGSIPTFIVASTGKANKDYAKAFEKATRPYRRAGIENMTGEAADNVFISLFVDHCLKGWSNVVNRDGSPIEYNRGNAVKLLDTLPRLFQQLQEHANSVDLFRDEVREEEAKN